MKIAADANIPYGLDAFSTLGQTTMIPGRQMSRKNLKDMDILFVRSVTRVDENLLSGSKIKFVGTATIGTDHVDMDYLEKAGIGFSSAPGCNADSVADYMTCALLYLADKSGTSLENRSIGIIGVGNVGSRVRLRAQALGMKVLLNDPPRQRRGEDSSLVRLEDLMDADFLTFHVPLLKGSPDATFHMVNHDFLSRLKNGCTVINASRGAVIDTLAVKAAIKSEKISACVLDVWENEPSIDAELLDMADLATPHIAGYSLNGKINGTTAVYRAACRHFNIPAEWDIKNHDVPNPCPVQAIENPDQPDEQILRKLCFSVYPIDQDSNRLKSALSMPPDERGTWFDSLRKNYPIRREFKNCTINGQFPSGSLKRKIKDLGFITSST